MSIDDVLYMASSGFLLVSVSVDIFRRVESDAVFKRFASLQPSIKLLEARSVYFAQQPANYPVGINQWRYSKWRYSQRYCAQCTDRMMPCLGVQPSAKIYSSDLGGFLEMSETEP